MLPACLFVIALWGAQAAPAAPDPELGRQNLAQLLTLRRVYVDKLNGGETASQLRDMIISSLERSRLFAITENPDRADAVLRGSAEDLVFTDSISSSEGVSARAGFGGSNGATTSSKKKSGYANASVGDQDSIRISERKHEATASVRLVTKEGDVIWSTTQESLGAKFRGASADVADKITRQLLAEFERAKKMGNRRTE